MPDTTLTEPRPSTAASRPLAGRRALVTGSTSGIGLGIAKALAAAGCDVALNARGMESEGIDLARDLAAEADVRAEYLAADMSVRDQVKACVVEAERRFGRLDIVVNNAGIQHVEPIETFPDDRWEQVLAIDLSSTFYATKAALPGMKQRGFGRIINVASAHGLIGSPFKAAYVAAKHGVVGLTKVTALETAEHGITCNAICPGYVWTPLVQKQIPEQAKAHNLSEEEVVKKVLLAKQPTKKFATVEEMGALAVFLAGAGASSITGAAIPIDGGWVAQ